jgi:hypothetical protein
MNTIYTITIIFVCYKLIKFILWLNKNKEPDDIGIMDLND